MRLLASVVFPVAALLSATAPEIFGVILGPKWDAASTLLRVFIPFYALNVVSAQSGAVLLARGRGWLLFWISVFLTAGRIGVVCVGPLIGQVGIAFGIGAVLTLYSLLMFEAPGYMGSTRGRVLGRMIVPPVLSSVVAAAICYELAGWAHGNLIGIALCWLAGAMAVAVLAAMQRKTLRQDLAALRALLRSRGGQ